MTKVTAKRRSSHGWLRISCAAAMLLPAIAAAQTAPSSGVLQVTARIESGCRVVGQLAQTQTLEFGSLDFGSHPSIFTVPLSAKSQGPAGTLQLTCIGIASVSVSVGTGLHASGNQRYLASGPDRVAYDLYADAELSLPFDNGTSRSIAISPDASAATVDLSIYGRIQPVSGGHAAGSYEDQVQIVVAW